MENNRKKIKKLIELVIASGGKIRTSDYGLSVDAIFPEVERELCLSQALMPERDGYTGFRIIDEEILKVQIKNMINYAENKSAGMAEATG